MMRVPIIVLVVVLAAHPAAGRGPDAPPVDDPPITVTAAHEGVTRVAVVIGTNGHVTHCRVVEPSGSPRTDDAVCRMALEKVSGRPATSNGTPVVSEKIITVRWKAASRRSPGPCYSTSSTATVSPVTRWLSAAAMNGSRAPSRTSPGAVEVTPVRRSLTSW